MSFWDSFWGLDPQGKQGKYWPNSYGDYSQTMYKQRIQDANKYENQGDWWGNRGAGVYDQYAQNGVGTPGDIKGYGSQFTAPVEGTIGKIQGGWNNVPTAANTMSVINQKTADQGTSNQYYKNLGYDTVNNDKSANSGIINQNNTEDANVLDGTSSQIEQDIAARYPQLMSQNDGAYGTASDLTERLNPASEFAQAQVERAFAPEMAQTAGSLRRAGVDPSSVQGVSAMQNVMAARSRAADDAAAQGTSNYVGAKNALTLGQASNDINLSLQQGQVGRDAASQYIDRATALNDRTGNLNLANQQRNTNLQLDTQNQNYSRDASLLQQQQQNALLNKSMATNDWQTQQGIDLNALNLRQGALTNEYNTGLGYQGANMGAKMGAAQGEVGYGENLQNNQYKSDASALGYGKAASDAYATAYNYNEPSAGWGSKLLAGMAAPALMAAGVPAPAAMMFGGAASGVAGGYNSGTPGGYQGGGGGGYGQGGGGGTYGSGWGGNTNPYQFNYGSNPYAGSTWNPSQGMSSIMSMFGAGNGANARSYGYYDPSQTQTLGDGSLQVGGY